MRAHAVAAFTAAGLSPGVPGFQQSFSWSGNATANVVAVLPGNDPVLKDEVVIVGAHHDHMGSTSDYGCNKQGGNSICNGADDNGTGSVAVLAIARALGQLKGQNRRTLVFLLFGAEERGLKGSAHYIANPLYPLAQTVYMANIDMIGDSSGSVDALGAGRSQLASGWIKGAATSYGINAQVTNSAGSGSDHYNFALEGVPYVFFHTGLSACFHTTCDTAEKIHYPQLTKITRAIARFLWSIAQSDQSPRTDFVSPTQSVAVDLTDWRVFTDQQDHAL